GPHRHPYDEIQFVREGRGLWTVNGEEFEAGAGDIRVPGLDDENVTGSGVELLPLHVPENVAFQPADATVVRICSLMQPAHVALITVLCDSTVWSELGAAMPGSGGSFGYLRQGYGAEKVGRLMGFLFVWQFVLSGPLEIASGYIGFSHYLGYIWKGITPRQTM